jgi:Predicted integral membrane metal-binding protein
MNVFNSHCSRKYTARLQEQEEQIETLLVKINNLEKQKSRLQSEVEVLIIDLEKVSQSIYSAYHISITIPYCYWAPTSGKMA